jgi:chromate transporter
VLRSALVPVTTGLIIASGIVMAQAADVTWRAIAVTGATAVAMLTTRLNPLWLLTAGGALGGLGFLE